MRDVRYYAPLAQGLLVSRPHDVYIDVLVPRAGTDEWELWFFVKEGPGAHRSFADFLRYQVGRPELRPKADRADELVRLVREGNDAMLRELAELGDPRTGELATEIMLDQDLGEQWRLHAVGALRLLADPRSVPALRRAWASARGYQLRVNLLAALETSGDPDLDELLEQLAKGDRDERIQRSATARLKLRR